MTDKSAQNRRFCFCGRFWTGFLMFWAVFWPTLGRFWPVLARNRRYLSRGADKPGARLFLEAKRPLPAPQKPPDGGSSPPTFSGGFLGTGKGPIFFLSLTAILSTLPCCNDAIAGFKPAKASSGVARSECREKCSGASYLTKRKHRGP